MHRALLVTGGISQATTNETPLLTHILTDVLLVVESRPAMNRHVDGNPEAYHSHR